MLLHVLMISNLEAEEVMLKFSIFKILETDCELSIFYLLNPEKKSKLEIELH